MEIRLGRLSHYFQDNPVKKAAEGEEPGGAGHQTWTGAPCNARVGSNKSNPYYAKPWQALWIPTTAYVAVPNVLLVKTDKKLEIGGVGTATIDVDNILYPGVVGVGGSTYHKRERGALSPLRGLIEAATEFAPDLPAEAKTWLEELAAQGDPYVANEWSEAERLAFAAQITVSQGVGESLTKKWTGLIEDIDSTSRPDRITITARDFGQVFTDTHFIGWGKDPIINTPVVFMDVRTARQKLLVGYNASASMEDKPKFKAANVLDFNEGTSWETNTVHSAEQTEYVDIALPEGVYRIADIAAKFSGMNVYISLRPAKLTGELAPTRHPVGGPAENLTVANKKLDKAGWVDLHYILKPGEGVEQQLVPGVEGGNSYLHEIENYPLGQQSTPLELFEGLEVAYRCGKNSILRLSFRKLHKVEAGENFRAGIKEFHGLREATEEADAKEQWVTTEDIADVVRILCQWAGFKEWDIPDTGTPIPAGKRIVCFQEKSYIDVIKEIGDGIGFTFFIADPTAGAGSLGVPTFRKQRLLAADNEVEKVKREEGIEKNGNIEEPHRGSTRPGLPNLKVTDRELLTDIKLKQTNAPLSGVIRVYGTTGSLPGNPALAIENGKYVVYAFRPPWAGTPPYYHDTRLGGVQKDLVHHDPLFDTVDLCRNAAWIIALGQAIESAEATVEIPGIAALGLELDDHILLLDEGTGTATRLAILGVSSSFADGEKRKFTTSLTGVLLDQPNVRNMVNIINGLAEANGAGGYLTPSLTVVESDMGYE